MDIKDTDKTNVQTDKGIVLSNGHYLSTLIGKFYSPYYNRDWG